MSDAAPHQDVLGSPASANPGGALGAAISGSLDRFSAYLASEKISPREIHLARREAKSLRALAALASAPLAAFGAQTILIVNQARRILGGARDADVRCETLGRMQQKLGEHYASMALLLVSDPQERPSQGLLVPEQRALAALARDWRLADAAAMQTSAIIAAAAATYRRAQKRAAKTQGGETRALHRLRSAIVDHQNQLEFLADFASDLAAQASRARNLRKYLGDLNDLDMTCAFLIPRIKEEAALASLQAAAQAYRSKHLERARAIMTEALAPGATQWAQSLNRSFGQNIESPPRPDQRE